MGVLFLRNSEARPCKTCGAVFPCYTMADPDAAYHRHLPIVVETVADAGGMATGPVEELPDELRGAVFNLSAGIRAARLAEALGPDGQAATFRAGARS
jgi:hypothetical protein